MPRSPSRSRSRTRSERSRSPDNARNRDLTRSPAKRRSRTPDGPSSEGCPFLIRLFVTKGKHTPMLDFDQGKLPVRDEFQVYGWKTSTPTSIIQLLLPSFPPTYRSPAARYSFRHIYVDASPRGLYRHKDLVSFTGRELMQTVLPGPSSTDRTAEENGKERRLDMEMELDDMPSVGDGRRDRGGGGKKVEEKTLEEYGFVTGDLISVSLFVPEPRGLRRPTLGAGETANGPPGIGGGLGAVSGGGRGGDFGWGGANPALNGGNGAAPSGGGPGAGPRGSLSAADRTGQWERGAALPPQHNARPGTGPGMGMGTRGGRGGGFGIRGAGGPADRRDGGEARDGRDGRDGRERREGWDTRGAPRRRSRSPDYRNGARSSRSRSRSRSPRR